jgi:lysophospholipase L1-like esterase
MKRTLRQALIAFVLTLVGIELVLQLLGAFGAPIFVRGVPLPGSADAITILCVGDSYTYGAPLPEPDSYPAQLQVLLEKTYPSRKFRVVNLGVPGVNSTFVASRLESELVQIHPKLLMVSAGLNDRWNDLRVTQESVGVWDAIRRTLLRVKLFRLIAVATEKGQYVPTESGAGRWQHADQDAVKKELRDKFMAQWSQGNRPVVTPSEDQIKKIIEHDMESIINTARGLDTPVIWYTYPELDDWHNSVVAYIKDKAQRMGVPVVESEKSRTRAMADGYVYDDLFVSAAGPHPTRILYGYIVEDMLPVVAAQLKLDE